MQVMLFGFIVSVTLQSIGFLQLSDYYQDLLIDEVFEGDWEARGGRIDGLNLAALLLYITTFFGTAIAYGFFYVRSMMNAKHLEPDNATVATHGMYWWFAIPVACLWKPLEGVMQVWRVLRGQADQPDSVPFVFAIWWGCFIISGIISSVLERVHPGAGLASSHPVDAQNYLAWSLLPYVVYALSAVCLYWITERIYKAQEIIVQASQGEKPVEVTETEEAL